MQVRKKESVFNESNRKRITTIAVSTVRNNQTLVVDLKSKNDEDRLNKM